MLHSSPLPRQPSFTPGWGLLLCSKLAYCAGILLVCANPSPTLCTWLQGVANRDLKLENLLLDRDCRDGTRPLLKICDFGYSKVSIGSSANWEQLSLVTAVATCLQGMPPAEIVHCVYTCRLAVT